MTLVMVLANFGLGFVVGTLVTLDSHWSEWASVLYIWAAGFLFGAVLATHQIRERKRMMDEIKELPFRVALKQLRKVEAGCVSQARANP